MSDLKKGLLIGILIGMAIGAPLAWAATRAVLVNGGGNEVGITGSPLYIDAS